ncbi:MAG: regulatory signaling modulator protein AmpE [Stenotrophobium sp.]
MTFIGILVALALERLLGHYLVWQLPGLIVTYARGLMRLVPVARLWRSWAAPLVLIVPSLVLVYELHGMIVSPIVDLLWSAGILLLCLGPRDLSEDVHALLAAHAAGDAQAEATLARALQAGPHADASHRTLIGALFIQSHERLFGVLLWFFALGPMGAVLYRFASRLPRLLNEVEPDSQAARVAETLQDLLAWIPARITALLYGLAGSLDDAIKAWRALALRHDHPWRTGTWAVLAEVPAASLGMELAEGGTVVPATLDAALHEVLRMQLRALLILLAGFAIFATGLLMQ